MPEIRVLSPFLREVGTGRGAVGHRCTRRLAEGVAPGTGALCNGEALTLERRQGTFESGRRRGRRFDLGLGGWARGGDIERGYALRCGRRACGENEDEEGVRRAAHGPS